MQKSNSTFFNLIALIILWSGSTFAIESNLSASQQLKPFQQLIGGSWFLQDSFQEFEWGIGNQSVKSRSYFIKDNQSHLVSEGFWYWDPAKKVIRGVFTAIHMPFSLVEYTTTFEANKMNSQLITSTPNGEQSQYIETWEFTDKDHYNWTLEQQTDGKFETIMNGIFQRKTR